MNERDKNRNGDEESAPIPEALRQLQEDTTSALQHPCTSPALFTVQIVPEWGAFRGRILLRAPNVQIAKGAVCTIMGNHARPFLLDMNVEHSYTTSCTCRTWICSSESPNTPCTRQGISHPRALSWRHNI